MARGSRNENQFGKGSKSRKRKHGRGRELAKAWMALLVIILFVAGAVAGGGFLILRFNGQKAGAEPREESRAVVSETLPEGEPTADDRPSEEKARELLENMTLEQKTAQLFFVTPEQLTGYAQVTAAGKASKEAYVNCPVGGLIYFKDNLQTPEQVKAMLEHMEQYSREAVGVPVFLGVDEEGGTVSRIGSQEAFGVAKVPDMAAIGSTGDVNEGYEAGKYIGGYLSELGFNLDFAPVADVLSNSDNTSMAKRTFGTDAKTAADFSTAFARGMKEQGLCSVLKHFPGQGSVSGDTHDGFAATDKTLDQLLENDLIPFKRGIEDGADMIMAAHIAVPSVTGDNTPSSLSKDMITGILRERMGYDKVVVTDALNMGAVAEHYNSDVAAVMAVQAGADLLLMPKDFKAAYDGVLSAVKDGRISEERLNQSVLRILKLKFDRLQ